MAAHLDHNSTSPMHSEVGAAISFSAFKFEGLQGIGTLAIANKPHAGLISAGDQQGKKRAATENLASIVALGKGAQVARLEMASKRHHLQLLVNNLPAVIRRAAV